MVKTLEKKAPRLDLGSPVLPRLDPDGHAVVSDAEEYVNQKKVERYLRMETLVCIALARPATRKELRKQLDAANKDHKIIPCVKEEDLEKVGDLESLIRKTHKDGYTPFFIIDTRLKEHSKHFSTLKRLSKDLGIKGIVFIRNDRQIAAVERVDSCDPGRYGPDTSLQAKIVPGRTSKLDEVSSIIRTLKGLKELPK